ncbi:MAG: (Fe-S)-binding protein [Planctomycetes bacterium]|nr:(Fe-S)-binding protein [Planctomycetota bacterium]
MNPIVMTLMLVVGLGYFTWTVNRRWRLMEISGHGPMRWDRIGERLKVTWRFALAQKRMRRYLPAGLAHQLIFLGFIVLLLRSVILFSRGYVADSGLLLFHSETLLGDVYSLLKDLFVVLVILGTLVFVYYRVVRRLPRMTLSVEGVVILGIILAMMVGDIVYDAAWMNQEARQRGEAVVFCGWAPVGSIAALAFEDAGDGTLTFLAHLGFWTHTSLVLIFLNLLPYSKHFHIITAIPNVFMQELEAPGRLVPIEDIEGRIEREETLGIRRINEFSWKSILDFYTCTECGRCSDHCPATKTGKKLSPMHFTIDLRNFLYEHQEGLISAGSATKNKGDGAEPDNSQDLVGSVIDPEVLWACTSCRACETECPVFITYVDKIVDMRRYLVQERGEFPSELQTAFRNLESSMNPWGFPVAERADWAKGLDVPLVSDKPDAEFLFWVGCAPSYDDRAKKTARATAELLLRAGVDFAILGPEEQCTGDPARRAGNEFLFQTLANANCETLNNHHVKKIVTTCPHCFNTLANEYSDFGGKFEVIHHSQLLADLVKQGKLKPTGRVDAKIAYHDSCYLGRYNDIYDAPREVLASVPGVTLVEPAETRDRGMCCGAGGAQMFKEEEPGDDRVNLLRTDQLLQTNPTVISSACPFCMRMLTDGLASKDQADVEQLDIAEVLLRSVAGQKVPEQEAASV